MQTKQFNTTQTTLIGIMAIALFVFGWVSVNIYLPALPSLGHDLNTPISNLKFSITLFLLGFSFAQLIWGPISEKFGRKTPLVFGLIISVIGIVMAMLATNIVMFNSGRFIEAIGLGAAPVLGRAILIDSLSATKFAVVMAYGTICANIMPAIAPIIGGHLLIWFGWRYIFTFLLIYGVILLISMLYKIPETHPAIKSELNILHTFKDYFHTLKNPKFVAYLLPYILVTGAMIGYYTLTPFLFINQLHLSASNYGYLSLITVGTYILGAMYSRAFSAKIGINSMVRHGTWLLLLAAAAFVAASIYFGLSILSILIPMAIYTFAAGIICPNSNAGAMHSMRHKAGAAAAVIGFSLYLISAVLSSIATALPITSLWPLAIYISLVALIAFVGFLIFNK